MERNYSSLKGITLAPSMSTTERCTQILSRGYLLTLAVCLSVYQSLCLSPSFLLTEMKELLFLRWLCAFVLVSLALCHSLVFSLRRCFRALQITTLKIKEINIFPCAARAFGMK